MNVDVGSVRKKISQTNLLQFKIYSNMNAECQQSKNEDNITKSFQGRMIYKDQCVSCFHEPMNEGGLYVCMKCFNGFCPADRDRHTNDHKHPLFINVIMTQKNVEDKVQITKLAIGVQGGALGGPEYETTYKIYCVQCKAHDFEGSSDFAPLIQSLANTQSPFKKQAAVAWEVQVFPCEHTLTLVQDPENKNLSKCVQCQLSTNLWLCLTCGNTGCGRQNWDGSGGNNHGVGHFESTGHPLVVKLGTITPDGNASLFCYKCNDDVKDESLPNHLELLGVAVSRQKKTEKTTTQMNIDLNLNFSLSRLAEGGQQQAIKLYGPGNTGMDNIGNSCYMNSVVQTLNSLPEWVEQYFVKGEEHRAKCTRIPSNCFYCQMAKVSWGLHSGKYSQKKTRTKIINEKQETEEYQDAIKPFDFKLLIAADNKDFNSQQQQDALEYMQWFFDRLEKEEHKYGKSIPQLFHFTQTNQMVCIQCNGYKQINENTNEWKVPVPPPTQADLDIFYQGLENEKNEELKKSKLCEEPDYPLDFKECISILQGGDSLQANCPKCGKSQFISHRLFKSTPRYLLVVPNRFVIQNFMQKKLNALIRMPEQLDVSQFLLNNSKPVGDLLTEEKKKMYDEASVSMLMDMGHSRNACIRALVEQHGNVEAACNWIFENMDNPNINDPMPEENEGAGVQVDAAAVAQVMEMGFEENQAKIALIKNNSSIPDAIQWLFNCGGDVSAFMDLLKAAPKPNQPQQEVGPNCEKYSLKAVIIHLGKTPQHGHYVAYVKKQGKWVLFNDDKVTIPAEPALGKGYVYLYESSQI